MGTANRSAEVASIPSGRLRAWWARWYWKRQARGLSDEVQPNPGVKTCHHVLTLETLGYCEPIAELAVQLGEAVAGTTEMATAAEMRRRLARELVIPAAAAMLSATDGSLGGFSWGNVGSLAPALANFRKAPALRHLSEENWQVVEERLRRRVGEGNILAVYAIGLSRRWRRGIAPVKQLLRPMFELGVRTSAHRAVWWAPSGSPVHGLAVGFGTEVIADVGGIAFFLHPDIRPLARIFAALPASVIATRFAKLVPARPPVERPSAVPRHVDPVREPLPTH